MLKADRRRSVGRRPPTIASHRGAPIRTTVAAHRAGDGQAVPWVRPHLEVISMSVAFRSLVPRLAAVLAVAYGLAFGPATARAELIYAISGQQLISFDSATPGTVGTNVTV